MSRPMMLARAALPETQHLTGAPELLEMLTYRRPAWSRTERKFINRFIVPLGVCEDAFGNLYKRIGTAPVLYSCHTDTVHMESGRQRVRVSKGIVVQDDARSNCLGADDTAGAWLMMEMIRADQPGLYVFHRAEEVGGKGSEFIAGQTPELLAGIDCAIAFDRRGHTSIITHQGGRCCSDAFAKSLARALGMGHVTDSGGMFTDTANYTGLIGECTNVSVGYMNEHTKRETLDLTYMEHLHKALLALDVTELVSARGAGEADPDDYDYSKGWPGHFDDDDQMPIGQTTRVLAALVRDHPDEVADWLEEYGITPDEIATAIYMRGGVLRR